MMVRVKGFLKYVGLAILIVGANWFVSKSNLADFANVPFPALVVLAIAFSAIPFVLISRNRRYFVGYVSAIIAAFVFLMGKVNDAIASLIPSLLSQNPVDLVLAVSFILFLAWLLSQIDSLKAIPKKVEAQIVGTENPPASSIRARMNQWFRKNSRWSRRYWIVPSGIVIGVFTVISYVYFSPVIGESQARTDLIFLVQVLATTLAISVSILMISSQFVSQTYTPRLSRVLFDETIFKGYLTTYMLAIFGIAGSLVVSFVDVTKLVVGSFFVFTFCQLYLLFLLFYVPRVLHPFHFVDRVASEIPRDFCQSLVRRGMRKLFMFERIDEPMITLEQILLRAVDQNDILTFIFAMEKMVHVLDEFLLTSEATLAKSEHKAKVRGSMTPVLEYFLRILREETAESLTKRREQHLAYLCETLAAIMTRLDKFLAFHAFDAVSKLYDYAGLSGVDIGLVAFTDRYVTTLYKLTDAQSDIMKAPLFPYDGNIEKWKELSEAEREVNTSRDIQFDIAFSNRLRFLGQFAEKASEKRLDQIAFFCLDIFRNVVNKSLELGAIKKRHGVAMMVLSFMEDAHEKCIAKGVNPSLLVISMMHYQIEKLHEPDEANEFGNQIATSYSRMSKASFSKGIYDDIWNWGVNGRYLVKKYPKPTLVVIDTLKEALDKLSSATDERQRRYYAEAYAGLESLRNWENHEQADVTSKIDELLKTAPRPQV